MSRPGRARLASMAAGYTAAMLVAMAAVAIIAERHPFSWDVTREHRHTLSADTKRVLASIPAQAEPVEILSVTSGSVAGGHAEDARLAAAPLMELLSHAGHVAARVVLAETEPQLVQQLGVEAVPVVVLRWTPPATAEDPHPAQRVRKTDVVSEAAVASALREIVAGRKHDLYLLGGHGEMKRTDGGTVGLARLAGLLESRNFQLHDLFLAGPADIPQDCELLLIAGPQSDLMPGEIAALQRYQDRGGRILLLHGPSLATGAHPMIQAWLSQDWSVLAPDGVVADLDAAVAGNQVTLVVRPPQGATHPIIRGFDALVELPLCRRIEKQATTAPTVTNTVLLLSGPRSWLEADLSTPKPHYDEGKDAPGPHPLAVAGVRDRLGSRAESRLVVIGSRHVASNTFVGEAGNARFLLNAVDWLSGHESEMAARASSATDGTVVIPMRLGIMVLVAALAIPVTIAAAGVVTWWLRRRL